MLRFASSQFGYCFYAKRPVRLGMRPCLSIVANFIMAARGGAFVPPGNVISSEFTSVSTAATSPGATNDSASPSVEIISLPEPAILSLPAPAMPDAAGVGPFGPDMTDGAGAARAAQLAQLKVGGAALSFGHLGPVIVNTDGTLRRIANWDTMTPVEQADTWRIIAKRNRERLAVLQAQGKSPPAGPSEL
jgi:hypothetical protein